MSVNKGVVPADVTTLAGQVRLLVGDTDATPIDGEPGFGEYAWYSDDELTALGTLFGNSARKVAIQVLSNVGISQVLLLKKWSSDDLSVDGPAILSAMEKTIARLSKAIDDESALADSFFDITPSGTYGYLPHPEGTAYPYYRSW